MSINYSFSELKELQRINLQMAQYFVDFCNKHDLLCYFCGGGCIGAVRHKGFIPWDDDLDFFMPRDDYEKLKSVWKDTNRYVLLYPSENYNDHNIFITMRDITTTMIKPYQQDLDIPHGVAMDIFPLDGCPESYFKRKKQIFWALLYQLFCAQIVPKNHGIIAQFIGTFVLNLIKSPKWKYRIWKYAEKEMSLTKIAETKYITELCAGPKYMFIQYPKELFSKSVLKAFEDTLMPIPTGYDGYLRLAFGDYMRLPPEEKRVASHDAVLLDLKNPYEKYKGKYYCN